MSWSLGGCHQVIDYDTSLLLYELGYQCVSKNARVEGQAASTTGIVAGIAAVAVLLIVVVICMCKDKKPKKEIQKPLLAKKSLNF